MQSQNGIILNEILIEISHNCNLSCNMCGFGRHINKYDSSKFMNLDNFFNIFLKIKNNTQSIRLNGRGESVIHKDFITIFEYVYQEKIPINLFTNLSFHKQKIIDVFKKTEPQLYISIDSPYKYNLEKIRVGANFEFILDIYQIYKRLIKDHLLFLLYKMKTIMK